MLIMNDVTVAYGDTAVLKGLTVDLEEGAIHGLVGINGSGKTTLFHTLYGWIKPKTGVMRWNGAPLLRKNIALLETQNYFYSHLKGKEYLRLFHDPTGSFALETWTELFKLPLEEFIEEYSTGMKKKLALTGILKLDKPVLLLDEPFHGVDMEAVHIIKLLLHRLKEKGKTVLITSHILEMLTDSCDYIHLLENGCIQRTYTKEETKEITFDLFGKEEQRLKNRIKEGL